ncbi:MAG: hypothetical protein U0174_14505 [Polyangiaceae bacterium]
MISGGFVMLGAENLGRAVRFYVETMGMKLARENALFARIDAGEGFSFDVVKGAPVLNAPLSLFARGDLDETVAIYENRGVVFTREDAQTARYRFVDTEGNHLCLTKA